MFFIFLKFILKEISALDLFLLFLLNALFINTVLSFAVKNPVYSLLFLIFNYSSVGFIFIIKGFLFIGISYMLIYIGAISVLILFTLMLLNFRFIFYKGQKKNYSFNVIGFFYLFQFLFFYVIYFYDFLYFDEFDNYINWFQILFLKLDSVNISFEIFYVNSEMLLVISFLILAVLIGAVNVVSIFKTSKQQINYNQFKNYKYNFSK